MILESKGVMDKEDICINLDGNTHLISLGYPMCTQLYFVTVLRSRLPNFLHTLIYTLCTQYYKKLFRCLQLTQYCILPAIFRTTRYLNDFNQNLQCKNLYIVTCMYFQLFLELRTYIEHFKRNLKCKNDIP